MDLKERGGDYKRRETRKIKQQLFLITRKYSNHSNSQKVTNTGSSLVQDHFMNQTVGFLDRNAVVNTSGAGEKHKVDPFNCGRPDRMRSEVSNQLEFLPVAPPRLRSAAPREYRGLPPGRASDAIYDVWPSKYIY